MPNPAITIIENIRSVSAGIPLKRTIVERKSVKKVKLRTNPVTTPRGRALPIFCPPIVEVKIIGKIGKIQGESTVTIPAKKENAISNIMIFY